MEELLSQFYIKLGGSNASEEMMDSLLSVEVDQSQQMPDMFSIHLHDPSFEWADADELDPGQAVEISAGANGGTKKLLKGEITAIEPEFNQLGSPTLMVRGFDKSHRLYRVKQTKTYLQVTDSDIVGTIAGNHGLSAQTDSTSVVHDYVLQDNQTDMEFITERAQRLGYHVYVRDDKLYFRRLPDTESSGLVLEWGIDLLEFQGRLTTAEQVTEVTVRGWDVKTKKEIIGKATKPQDTPQVGQKRSGGQTAKRAFNKESREIVVDRPVATQAEADALAQSVCDRLGNDFMQVQGKCMGSPDLRAGEMVNVKGVGERFSGRYRITRAIHRYDESGYTTEFEASGRRTNTLGELLAPKHGRSRNAVIGVVTNNRDPDGLGRVKVRFPTLPGNEESAWARLVSPMAGDERGMLLIPEVNDEVAIIFEHGDVNRPFMLGGLWNGKDKLPADTNDVGDSTGKVQKRVIRSRSGHIITIDDTSGKEKISIVDKTGKNSIDIDSSSKSVAIKAEGDIQLEAGGKVVITGKNIEMEASNAANVTGKNLTLEGTTQAALTGGASGTNVEAKSLGEVNVKGAKVNLN
jgi:phage protein D/phage baseplate assembly protein gpV